MARVAWSQFKSFVDSRKTIIHERNLADNNLLLETHDGCLVRNTKLKNGTSDYAEYTANYQPSANKPIGSQEVSGVKSANGMRARLTGMHNGAIPFGTTVNLDWLMPQLQWLGTNKDSYFDGIEYYTDGVVGDHCKFQVVDVDGVYYPAGTIVEEFGDGFYLFPDSPQSIILYRAKIVPLLYIRMRLTSTGGVNVNVFTNLYRHMDGNS